VPDVGWNVFASPPADAGGTDLSEKENYHPAAQSSGTLLNKEGSFRTKEGQGAHPPPFFDVQTAAIRPNKPGIRRIITAIHPMTGIIQCITPVIQCIIAVIQCITPVI
jgi:hypothetical protein